LKEIIYDDSILGNDYVFLYMIFESWNDMLAFLFSLCWTCILPSSDCLVTYIIRGVDVQVQDAWVDVSTRGRLEAYSSFLAYAFGFLVSGLRLGCEDSIFLIYSGFYVEFTYFDVSVIQRLW